MNMLGAQPNGLHPIEFDIPSMVPLVPGSLFVIEVVGSSGNTLIANTGGTGSNYSGGEEIFQGVPQPKSDFWFVEGLSVPEPR